MRRRTPTGTWLLLTVLALAPRAARAEDGQERAPRRPESAVEVALRERAELRNGFVRVRDVADLTGGDERTRERVGGVYLGRAPERGRQRRLAAWFVRARLEENGFGPTRVRVAGASSAVVTHSDGEAPQPEDPAEPCAQSPPDRGEAAEGLDHARLLARAVEFLASRLGCAAERLRVELASARVLRGEIPIGEKLTYQIQPCGKRLLVGRVRLVADAFVRGERVAEVAMDLDVTRFARVLVLTRPVRRGEKLAADGLRVAVLDVRSSAEYVGEVGQAAGRVAKRSLDAGTVLERDMIERPILVRRNRPVRLVLERGSLRLSETLIARDDGGLGELVRVERPATRQRFFACVAGDSTVTIPEGGL